MAKRLKAAVCYGHSSTHNRPELAISGLFLRASFVAVVCWWAGVGPRRGTLFGHSGVDALECRGASAASDCPEGSTQWFPVRRATIRLNVLTIPSIAFSCLIFSLVAYQMSLFPHSRPAVRFEKK